MSARHELRRLISNPALLIGLVGTLALLAMGVFGGLVAPYDPSANQSSIVTVLPDGRKILAFPPTLPDAQHWFGTDPIGRDQWSRILAGAWITLSVVVGAALTRLAIGFSLGLTSGWYGGPFARGLSIVATGITAVPQLLLAIMLVLVTRPLGAAGFIASLALVGWPEIGEFVRAEVIRAKTQPFIEAARSVGVPGRRLVTGHLFATVGPQLLTVAALETGAVLLLLAELGLIGLFLAGATFLVDDSGPVGPFRGRAAEWGQMLGGIQFYAITAELPTLIPALFVVLASAIFALLADGLRAASDPFSSRSVLPGTFGALTKVLVGALCFSVVGFIGVNVRPGAMSMEEGRSVAAKTAETTWPGSEFVAGVARYSSATHGIDRPERLTYYYRNDSNEVLRISFQDADRLAIEVRKYESEDEIDFNGLKALPAGAISYDTPLARAEQTGGADRRRILRSYVVRVILTWPKDRDAPVYSVRYDGTSGSQQGVPVCCFDAKTGALADSLFAPRAVPPWPVPADCAASRTVFRQIDRLQGYFTDGGGLSVGATLNLNYQGDNFLYIVGGQGTPVLESAVNTADSSARAELLNARATSVLAGQTISFASLRVTTPGCWKVRISVGTAVTEYTLYAYPWECRPAYAQMSPIPGVTPSPCTKP
ncbi:MAG TPA: ABC transporter permease [Candidatus Polarisedimenticolia bacterium]|nr:ABC transporter permease [Candidatus Polarisedimenticolia bacterium]